MDRNDMLLVMEQTNCNAVQARNSLIKYEGDIVNAILDLQKVTPVENEVLSAKAQLFARIDAEAAVVNKLEQAKRDYIKDDFLLKITTVNQAQWTKLPSYEQIKLAIVKSIQRQLLNNPTLLATESICFDDHHDDYYGKYKLIYNTIVEEINELDDGKSYSAEVKENDYQLILSVKALKYYQT